MLYGNGSLREIHVTVWLNWPDFGGVIPPCSGGNSAHAHPSTGKTHRLIGHPPEGKKAEPRRDSRGLERSRGLYMS